MGNPTRLGPSPRLEAVCAPWRKKNTCPASCSLHYVHLVCSGSVGSAICLHIDNTRPLPLSSSMYQVHSLLLTIGEGEGEGVPCTPAWQAIVQYARSVFPCQASVLVCVCVYSKYQRVLYFCIFMAIDKTSTRLTPSRQPNRPPSPWALASPRLDWLSTRSRSARAVRGGPVCVLAAPFRCRCCTGFSHWYPPTCRVMTVR